MRSENWLDTNIPPFCTTTKKIAVILTCCCCHLCTIHFQDSSSACLYIPWWEIRKLTWHKYLSFLLSGWNFTLFCHITKWGLELVVRIMTGTILEVETRKEPETSIFRILANHLTTSNWISLILYHNMPYHQGRLWLILRLWFQN